MRSDLLGDREPGRMILQMVGAFAEFERAMLRERTCAGSGGPHARRAVLAAGAATLSEKQQMESSEWSKRTKPDSSKIHA